MCSIETNVTKIKALYVRAEHPHNDLLAVHRGHQRHAQVGRVTFTMPLDGTILGSQVLVDAHATFHLDAVQNIFVVFFGQNPRLT